MNLVPALGVILCAFLIASCGSGGGGGGKAGDAGVPALPSHVSGKAQKGPMKPGTVVHLYELDASLVQNGRSFSSETEGVSAAFALPVNLTSAMVEMDATGYYFNEVSGADSDAVLTLRGIAKVNGAAPVNLNIATTICAPRTRALVGGGMAWDPARRQAESELCAIVGITDDLDSSFDQGDVTGGTDGDAALLALSCVVQGSLTTSALQSLIYAIQSDFAADGSVDAAIRTQLSQQSEALSLPAIRTNMLTLQGTVPAFERYAKRLVPLRAAALPGAIAVDPGSLSFSIVFNQELDPASIPSFLTLAFNGTTITAPIIYDDVARTLVVTSAQPAPADEAFTFSLEGIRSCSGNALPTGDAIQTGRTLPVELDRGLTTYLTFNDGTADDASGLGHDGQFLGTMGVPDMLGNAGAARGFVSGYSDRVAMPRTISFSDPNWSISLWLRLATLPTVLGHNAVPISNENPVYDSGWPSYNDDLPFYIHRGRNAWKTVSGVYGFAWETTETAEAGVWYHLVGVRDGDSYSVFLDGRLLQQISMGNDAFRFRVQHISTDRLMLGHDPIVGGDSYMNQDFDGSMDEVRVYDRSLNRAEVRTLSGMYSVPPVSN